MTEQTQKRPYGTEELVQITSMIKAGHSSGEISIKMGRHRASICEAIRRYKLPRLKGASSSKGGRKFTGGETKLIQALWQSGFSAGKISKRVGRTRNSVISIIHRTGTSRREKTATGRAVGLVTQGYGEKAPITLAKLAWMGNTDGRNWQEGKSI